MNCNFARVILVMVFVGLANLAFCQVEKGLTEGMKNISKLGSGISKSGLREMTSGTTPFLALSQGIKIDGEIMKATSITTSSPSVFFNEKPPQIMPEGLSFDFSPINSRELQASVKREPVSTSLLNQEKTLRSEHAFLWGKYGDASLIHAAREGLLLSVQKMVEQGAFIEDDAILAARDSKNIALLTFLVRKKGSNRITLQATWRYPDLLAELLTQPTFIDNQYFFPNQAGVASSPKDQRGTLLYFAASSAHPRSVELLCSFFRPTEEISDRMLKQAFTSLEKDRLEVARLLISQFGANPAPAISYIADQVNSEWIIPLKELGADVNFKNERGETPLFVITEKIPYQRNREEYIKAVDILLNNRADPTIPNAQGETPLQRLQERLEKIQQTPRFYPHEWADALTRTILLLQNATH